MVKLEPERRNPSNSGVSEALTSGIAQAPRPSVPATSKLSAALNTRSNTGALGKPVPSFSQLPKSLVKEQYTPVSFDGQQDPTLTTRLEGSPNARRRAAERVERDGAVYLQAYIPHPGRDLRVFVVGGVVRAAIVRHAPQGEWRTNVAGGGRAGPARCSEAVKEAAEEAASALGLDYAGVDLVEGPAGPTVLEVNGNPSWQGILEATGLDMSEAIADHVLARALRRRRGSDHIVRERTGATHG